MVLVEKIKNFIDDFNSIFDSDKGFNRFLTVWLNYFILISVLNFFIFLHYSILYAITAVVVVAYLIYCYRFIKEDKPDWLLRNLFGVMEFYIIVMTTSFGFDCGFQNVVFSTTMAFFLPLYSPNYAIFDPRTLRDFSITFLLTYACLYLVCGDPSYVPFFEVSDTTVKILYVMNSIETVVSIVLFAKFYISRNNYFRRVLTRREDFDELTNVYNRFAINKMITNMYQNSKKDFDIAIVDIDFFKKINDTYGHNAGDKVLQNISRFLKKAVRRDGTFVGRWGGEEFIIVSDTMSYHSFINLLKKIRKSIEEYEFRYKKDKIRLTVSIGANSGSKELVVEELIKSADDNLYKAKESGRNKVVS